MISFSLMYNKINKNYDETIINYVDIKIYSVVRVKYNIQFQIKNDNNKYVLTMF
jgi:hypothetical protein